MLPCQVPYLRLHIMRTWMEQQTEHLQRNGIIGRMRPEHFQQRIKKTCLRLTRCRMAELYSPMICMSMMERLLSRLGPIPVRRYLHRCITSYPESCILLDRKRQKRMWQPDWNWWSDRKKMVWHHRSIREKSLAVEVSWQKIRRSKPMMRHSTAPLRSTRRVRMRSRSRYLGYHSGWSAWMKGMSILQVPMQTAKSVGKDCSHKIMWSQRLRQQTGKISWRIISPSPCRWSLP